MHYSRMHYPPHPPFTIAASAPEDVKHPVRRRSEAHAPDRGGGAAGWGQCSPAVGRRAVPVQVVE